MKKYLKKKLPLMWDGVVVGEAEVDEETGEVIANITDAETIKIIKGPVTLHSISFVTHPPYTGEILSVKEIPDVNPRYDADL